MSESPWIGVMAIGGGFLAVLLLFLLLARSGGLRKALTSVFRWPLIAALTVGILAVSILAFRNGISGLPVMTLILASYLFTVADAPREAWARWLIWLDAAVLAGVPSILWLASPGFSNAPLWFKVLTVPTLSVVLWPGGASFLNIYRPKSLAASETETPA
ncbi:MAG: hypothetical protein GC145_02125 [Caulobacter sp.]|nr:hypothetical protein [Caulobacter sp.]